MAKLTIDVKKKGFTKDGKTVEFFELSADFWGETVKIKLDKDKNELFKYFLGKMDIPLELEDEKEALMKRMLAGEKLNEEEKAKLRSLLLDDEAEGK